MIIIIIKTFFEGIPDGFMLLGGHSGPFALNPLPEKEENVYNEI